jgi:ribonuclease HII
VTAKKISRNKVTRLWQRAKAAGETITRNTAKLRLIKSLHCTDRFEKQAFASGATLVAGVDEVGRGCLFGPVVAAAVILDPSYRIRGLRDSKLITAERREVLAERIKQHSVGYAIASVDVETIDRINIYHATRMAMLNAVASLAEKTMPDHLLVDALVIDFPSAEQRLAQTKIFYGDAQSISIAAASIIAKVERDRMMTEIAAHYPQFDIASNKGYRSPKHIAALKQHGPCELHRKSFAPVWNALHPQEELFAEGSEHADGEAGDTGALGIEGLDHQPFLDSDVLEQELD